MARRRVQNEVEGAVRNPEAVTRRAYRVGGSVAVRLPKKMAGAFGIQEGTPVRFKRTSTGILVERAE